MCPKLEQILNEYYYENGYLIAEKYLSEPFDPDIDYLLIAALLHDRYIHQAYELLKRIPDNPTSQVLWDWYKALYECGIRKHTLDRWDNLIFNMLVDYLQPWIDERRRRMIAWASIWISIDGANVDKLDM